jgi:chorismate mutase
MSIEDWRTQIDEIDRKLVALLNERTRCAIEIGKIKMKLHQSVFDPERERAVIHNVQRENRGPLDNDGLRRLFERVIDECRRAERGASKEE